MFGQERRIGVMHLSQYPLGCIGSGGFMEHDEYLKASKAAEVARLSASQKEEVPASDPELEENEEDKDEYDAKKKKKNGFDVKKIISSITEFFTPDNIE